MVDVDGDVRLDAGQVEDRRGRRLPGGRAAIGGGGGIVVLLIALLLGSGVLGGGSGGLGGLGALDGQLTGAGEQPASDLRRECRTGADADRREDCRMLAFVNSVQAFWTGHHREQGARHRPATTVFFSDAVQTDGCGTAGSEVGPFSCPRDERVHTDLGFFRDLHDRFGAEGGPFAQACVPAHEYGHHVQNLSGVLDRVNRDRGTGPQSAAVRAVLQADCLAGVRAADAVRAGFITNLSQEDIDQALDAAEAVGDDRIQERAGGRVIPESWTHGSSESRRWFSTGPRAGSPAACDTFRGTV